MGVSGDASRVLLLNGHELTSDSCETSARASAAWERAT